MGYPAFWASVSYNFETKNVVIFLAWASACVAWVPEVQVIVFYGCFCRSGKAQEVKVLSWLCFKGESKEWIPIAAADLFALFEQFLHGGIFELAACRFVHLRVEYLF